MSQTPNQPAPNETVQRAEALVDQWGQRLGHVLSIAGEQVRKATARAREEAEDIWAEAQHIRRGQPPQTMP
jgi:hypothetical protein